MFRRKQGRHVKTQQVLLHIALILEGPQNLKEKKKKKEHVRADKISR